MTCASCTRHISDNVHRNSTKPYRKNAHIVKFCNVKLFFHLPYSFQNYVNFSQFGFSSSNTIHRNSIRLCWKRVYIVNMYSVRLFFDLSKNFQNYANVCNCDLRFFYAPYLLFIGIQSNCTRKKYISWSCVTSSNFSISQNIVKIMSVFSYFGLVHLVRTISSPLFIGILSNFTDTMHI